MHSSCEIGCYRCPVWLRVGGNQHWHAGDISWALRSIVGSNIDWHARHCPQRSKYFCSVWIVVFFIPIHGFAAIYIVDVAKSIFCEKSKTYYFCVCDKIKENRLSLVFACLLLTRIEIAENANWGCQKRKLDATKRANWVLPKAQCVFKKRNLALEALYFHEMHTWSI